jgi:nitrogen regulatory protein P-II 1
MRDEAEYKSDSEAGDFGARRGRDAEGVSFVKVEAVVIRERIETVIDAVEHETGHVGVTVVEAVGHGRQRGITHEYRGRVFESRFLPKALLVFVADAAKAEAITAAIVDAARSGNESGDGIVWTTAVENVTHNRTARRLEEVDVGA